MLTIATQADALRWTERLVALALIVGTLELLARRHLFSDTGIWRWTTLRRELPWLEPVLAYRSFLAVLGVQLIGAILLLAGVRQGTAPLLWITTLLVCLRFRGTFNGGSDAMLMVLLTALSLAQLGVGHPVVGKAALLYIAVQSTLSYLIAGVAKLAHAEWRTGEALQELVQSRQYGVPAGVQRLLARRGLAGAATAGILLFECGFPLAWLGPRTGLGFVTAAASFHLANVAVFGLNRFLMTWVATYPALLYAASHRW